MTSFFCRPQRVWSRKLAVMYGRNPLIKSKKDFFSEKIRVVFTDLYLAKEELICKTEKKKRESAREVLLSSCFTAQKTLQECPARFLIARNELFEKEKRDE